MLFVSVVAVNETDSSNLLLKVQRRSLENMNFVNNSVVEPSSELIHDCLLLVICSLYTTETDLLPQEIAMKNHFQ